MVATFKPDLSNPVSKVRQLIGDTDVSNLNKVEVQDETILAYMAAPFSHTVTRAAAQLAYDISAKYARLADTTIDDQLTRWQHVTQQYKDLGDRLTAAANREDSVAGAGGSFSGVMVTGIGDCRGPLDNCAASSYDCPTC